MMLNPITKRHFLAAVQLCIGLMLGSTMPMLTASAQEQEREVSVPEFSGRPPDEHPILAPCSRFDDRYAILLFRDNNVEEWPDIYHERVKGVIEEYLEPIDLTCTADGYTEFLEPGDKLLELAADLPTWNDPDVPLSRFDLSRVLLEYLRIYECALMEFDTFLYYDTYKEEADEPREEDDGDSSFISFFLSDLLEESAKRAGIINHERTIARKTLNRVLTLITTAERLRPLEAELECMQRMSLDMRNAASLTAEASSCLPRVWNAKDVLRDYPEEDE